MSEDKRRRFPIPKPGLMLAVGFVLVVIAVGLSVWMPYQWEQVAVREIERLGGSVGSVRGGPDWLRGMGMVALDRVVAVHLRGVTSIGNDDLKHLSGFDSLESLWLDDTQISDAGLKHLSGLANLNYLSLKGTQVTDEGVESLKKKLPRCAIVR